MINNIGGGEKGKGRALVLKKYSVGIYKAGSNLLEEWFHYLRGMRTVCLRVEKCRKLSMNLCWWKSIYGINVSRNMVI